MGILRGGAIASHMADVANRLDVVRQDPAVVKASKQAWSDTKQASKSVVDLAVEVNTAWRRSGRPRAAMSR